MKQTRYLSALDRFSKIGALLVASLGAAVLVGWFGDVARLRTVLPGLATMKVNTACGFLAAGLSLWLLQSSVRGSRSRRLGRALAVFVIVLGGLTLAEDLLRVDLGIDQLLLRDTHQTPNTVHAGRMTTTTALSYLLMGLALLAIKSRHARIAAHAQWCAVPGLFIGTLAIVGYAFGMNSLFEVGSFSAIAVHTGVALCVLPLAILAADPAHGIANLVVSDTAGGLVARRLLPTMPLLIFGLGWMCLKGHDLGLYNAFYGLALMAVLSMTVSIVAVSFTAVRLHSVDLKRANADAEIIALNAGLERRVQERTQELENTLAQVKQLSGLLPLCAWCKKVRDDQDYWHSVEEYVTARTEARFSHGICPECSAKVMAPEVALT